MKKKRKYLVKKCLHCGCRFYDDVCPRCSSIPRDKEEVVLIPIDVDDYIVDEKEKRTLEVIV